MTIVSKELTTVVGDGRRLQWKSIFCEHTSILHGVLVDAGSLRIKEQPFPVVSNPLKNLWFSWKNWQFSGWLFAFSKFWEPWSVTFWKNCTYESILWTALITSRALFLIFNSQHWLALTTWSAVSFTQCWSLLKCGQSMVVPCSFSRCSEEFQYRLLWASCFYHNHSSISKQNYSKEWRNWKWYRVIWWMKIQHISSKLHKNFQDFF